MIGLVVYFFIIQAAISSARPEGEAAAAATYVETPTDAATISLGECEPGWKSLSNGCYFTEVNKMNWQAAKDFCTEKKAKMVVMDNKEIQEEITAAFKDLITEPKKNRFWLDAKEADKDGAKVWKVNDGAKEATFLPWGSKDTTKAEDLTGDCIRSDDTMNWWKAPCTADEFPGPYPFLPLCVKPIIQKCLSNGCYFTEERKMNWQAAKDFCTENNAKMVVIDNKEIQEEITEEFKEFITEPKRNRFWLDAKEADKDGAKVWKVKDGAEEATFMPWGSRDTTKAETLTGDCIRSDDTMNWWKASCTDEEFPGKYIFVPLCVRI